MKVIDTKKIIFMGLSASGKTSIQAVALEGKDAQDVQKYGATIGYARTSLNIFGNTFQIIDCGGQDLFIKDFLGEKASFIFSHVKFFIWVVDASDLDKVATSKQYFENALKNIIEFSPDAKIAVLFHKMDLLDSEEKEAIIYKLKQEFIPEKPVDILYRTTSIYDQSLFSIMGDLLNVSMVETRIENVIIDTLRGLIRKDQLWDSKINLNLLVEEQLKYKVLVENLDQGILLEDSEGFTSLANPKIASLLGYSPNELIGKHWTKIITLNKNQIPSTDFYTERKKKRKNYEANLISKEGTLIPVIIWSHPIYSGINLYSGLVSVITNISTQKRMQQLHEQFVSIANHEIRTPLTVIYGYIDFLMKSKHLDEEEKNQIFYRIEKNIERVLKIIDSISDYSKIRTEVFKITKTPVMITEFLQMIIEQLPVLYPERLILTNWVSERNHDTIIIDLDRIVQVINNITNNSVKNSPQNSTIEISFTHNPNDLVIIIQDYGSGIQFQNLIQLFQPFVHFDTKYTKKGTGLGLFIVKNIILAHGGRVEVHTQEKNGTAFVITIPT